MALLHSEYSLDFDGIDDRIEFGNVLNFERTNSFSFSFWYKSSSISGALNTLISRSETSGSYRGYIIQMNSGVLTFTMRNTASTNELQYTIAPNIVDGQWHHVVFTYDGSSAVAGCSAYVDGEEYLKTTIFNNLSSTIQYGTDFRLMGNLSSDYCEGKMDEVSVYDKALLSSEVITIYNNGKPIDLSITGPTANLIGYWYMGDGDTYPTVMDHSTIGNDGTMTSMAANDIVIDAPMPREAFYSMLFDGTDSYVDIGNVAELSFERTNSFSISTWFKTQESSSKVIYSKYSTNGYYLSMTSTGSIQLNLTNTVSTNELSVRTTAINFNDGEFHHVVVTYNGTSSPSGVIFIVDGVVAATTTVLNTLSSSILNAINVNIGRRTSSLYFRGVICELSVWNKVLSTIESQRLYNSGRPRDARVIRASSNLVGYWPLDDKTSFVTVPDLSVSDNDGTATNMTVSDIKLDAPGVDFDLANVSTKSIVFDGTGYINVGNVLNFSNTDIFSIGIWFKTDGLDPGVLISKMDTGGTDAGWLISIETGGILRFIARNTSSTEIRIDSQKNFADNIWHYLSVTYSGSGVASGVIFYVDGVAVPMTIGQNDLSGSMSNTAPLSFGARVNAASTVTLNYGGSIDDIVIYNKVLSEVEIRTIYGARAQTNILENMPLANLVGYWKMGDGDTYPTIIDHSSGSNNGTMTSMTADDIVNDVSEPIDSLYSIDFDGVDDELEMVGSVATFDFATPDPRTVMFWIKDPAAATSQAIVGNLNSAASFIGWEILISSSNTIQFRLINASPGPAAVGSIPYTATGWNYIAWTYDGSGVVAGMRAYVNGLPVAVTNTEDDLAGGTSVSTLDLTVGRRHNATTALNAQLDGLAIYDRVLSPSEIILLGGQNQPVDHGAVGPINSLVGWWQMGDPGSSVHPTIADLAASKNNPGTMTNMVSGDIIQDSSSASYFRMRGISTISGYVEWVENNKNPDFDGSNAPASIVLNSSVAEAGWKAALKNYYMRALVDPGPGYVYWESDASPDYAGNFAGVDIIRDSADIIIKKDFNSIQHAYLSGNLTEFINEVDQTILTQSVGTSTYSGYKNSLISTINGDAAFSGAIHTTLSNTLKSTYTISAMVKLDTISGLRGIFGVIHSSAETLATNYLGSLRVNNATFGILWEYGSGVNQSFLSGSVLATNTWYLLSARVTDTAGTSVVELLIDGVVVATSGSLTTAAGGTSSFPLLGALEPSPALNLFDGQIKFIDVSNVARSNSYLSNMTTNGNLVRLDSNTVARYRPKQ